MFERYRVHFFSNELLEVHVRRVWETLSNVNPPFKIPSWDLNSDPLNCIYLKCIGKFVTCPWTVVQHE